MDKKIVQKARDWFAEDRSRWIKGAYGRDSEGVVLDYYGLDKAVSCCLVGGLIHAGADFSETRHFFGSLLDTGVITFNDNPSTTYEDVLALLDRAIATL